MFGSKIFATKTLWCSARVAARLSNNKSLSLFIRLLKCIFRETQKSTRSLGFNPCQVLTVIRFPFILSSSHPVIRLFIHPSVHPSIYPSFWPSVCSSIHSAGYPSVHPSICASIRPSNESIHTSIRLSAQSSMLLFIHPSISPSMNRPSIHPSSLDGWSELSPINVFICQPSDGLSVEQCGILTWKTCCSPEQSIDRSASWNFISCRILANLLSPSIISREPESPRQLETKAHWAANMFAWPSGLCVNTQGPLRSLSRRREQEAFS